MKIKTKVRTGVVEAMNHSGVRIKTKIRAGHSTSDVVSEKVGPQH